MDAGAAPQLPPGWTAHWQEQYQRYSYANAETGENTWEPPVSLADPSTVMQAGSPPPGAAHAASAGGRSSAAAARSRRAYASSDMYYGGGGGVQQQTGQPMVPGMAPAQAPAFFSPAQPHTSSPYGPQTDAQPFVDGANRAPNMYGQQQQQGGVPGMTQQFGQMGFGSAHAPGQPGVRPLQTVNVLQQPTNPIELLTPPPEPNLPPNASFSLSPYKNADVAYQRCTMNAIPTTHSVMKQSKVPCALVCTPYRSIKEGEPPVPVVHDYVIARCRRCRTYINPYVTFLENGNRWKCCMCNLTNDVPAMFDWNQAANQPADRWARPELNHAVVDFVAPTEYMVRAPQPPFYVFLLDVSYQAVHSGMLATAARTLLESLDRLPNGDGRTKISIIGVDSALHFFKLSEGKEEPELLVLGDLDDVFLPSPTDLLVPLSDARAGLDSLLSRIGEMFKDNHNTGSAMGSALQAAYQLISHIGGKVFVLSSTLPSVGPGALKEREDTNLYNTPKESTLLQPATDFYKKLATDCSRQQISVDMWLFNSTYTDVASLNTLPKYTGGQTYYYRAFNAGISEDALKFAHEFSQVVTQPFLLEAVLRVRASRGLRMAAYHGNAFVRSTDLLALSTVTQDQAYSVEVQIEDPLSQPFVVFQTAVLHTTSFGERRIRVVTSAYPTTTNVSDVFASVDQVALATHLAHKAVERSLSYKLEDARDALTNKLTDILQAYKNTMASSGATPQLICSESMKYLPLLILALLKHVAFRQSGNVASDLRAYAQALLTTLPPDTLIPYIHPTLYSLHNMPTECGHIGEHGVVLPPPLPLSSAHLERHGLHLLEDGQVIFLMVGRDAVPQLLEDVFGVSTLAEVASGKATLPQLDNEFSQRVNAIIGKVRESRRGPYYPQLYIVREDGDQSLQMWFLSMLIEDRFQVLPSYSQFLTQIKGKVNPS